MSRILIRGGTVLTMEPGEGPVQADVLVEDERIAQIAPRIAADAELIDATGSVVIPGLVDTHRHVWQAGLRGVTGNAVLKDYFRSIRFQASPVYRPEDIYIGNLAGMLEAIDAGVTTVLDFCHAIVTPEHADAAIDGSLASGIRSQFAVGFSDMPGRAASLTTVEGLLALTERLYTERLSSADALVTLGVALSDLPEVGVDRTRAELQGVRRLGLRSTTNGLAILFHDPVDDLAVFTDAGLHGPDILWVHLNYATHNQLEELFESGGHVAVCPEAELAMGMGRPVTDRALAVGGQITFGCDVTTTVSGSLLTQARTAMQVARLFDADEGMRHGRAPAAVTPDARTMLQAATIWGAEALAQDSHIGSLRAGKRADITVISGKDVNTAPVNDPYATVIGQAHAGNVSTVVIDGAVVKRDGALVADWAAVRSRLEASRSYLREQVERAGGFWPSPAVELPW